MNSNVIQQRAFGPFDHNDGSNYLTGAFRYGHMMVCDDVVIVVDHRTGRLTHSLDVMFISCLYSLENATCISGYSLSNHLHKHKSLLASKLRLMLCQQSK